MLKKTSLLLVVLAGPALAADRPSPIPPELWTSSALLLEYEKIHADAWGESVRALKDSPGLFPAKKENRTLRDQFAMQMKEKKALLRGTFRAREGNGFQGEWNLAIRCGENAGWDDCDLCSEHHLNGRKRDFTHRVTTFLGAGYSSIEGLELNNPGNPNLSVETGMPFVGAIYAFPAAFETHTNVYAFDLDAKKWITTGKMEWKEGPGSSCFEPFGSEERERVIPAIKSYETPSPAAIAATKRSQLWLEGARRKSELNDYFFANWKGNNSFGIYGLQGLEEALSREADGKARTFLGKKKKASFSMRVQLSPATDKQLLLDFGPNKDKRSVMRIKAAETQFDVTNGYISFNEMNSGNNQLYTYQPRLGTLLLFEFLGSEEIIHFGGRYNELRVEFPLDARNKVARIFGWNVDDRDWEILSSFSWKELSQVERDALIADWKLQDFKQHPEERPKISFEAVPLN